MKKMACAFCFALIGLVCFVGCAKDEGFRKTSCVVTLDGQPIEGAAVTFYSDSGDGGSGITDATGACSVTSGNATKADAGVKPGSYKVTVVKRETVVDEDQAAFDAGEITYDELQERKAEKGTTGRSAAGESLVPIQYSRINETPLTATVTENEKENVFTFELVTE